MMIDDVVADLLHRGDKKSASLARLLSTGVMQTLCQWVMAEKQRGSENSEISRTLLVVTGTYVGALMAELPEEERDKVAPVVGDFLQRTALQAAEAAEARAGDMP